MTDEPDRLRAIALQYQTESAWADTDAIEVNLGVLRASDAFKSALNRHVEAHGLGISRSRYALLRTLHFAKGPMAQHQVGKTLGVSRMNITKLLDGLEKDGLVVRKAHPTDRRVTLAELTPAGEALSIKLLPIVSEFMGDICKDFSDDEKQVFKDLLRRFWEGAASATDAMLAVRAV